MTRLLNFVPPPFIGIATSSGLALILIAAGCATQSEVASTAPPPPNTVTDDIDCYVHEPGAPTYAPDPPNAPRPEKPPAIGGCAPGPDPVQEQAVDYPDIEVSDYNYSIFNKIVWDPSGLEAMILGSHFQSGEAVSLTIKSAVDEIIGSSTANDSGAFAAHITLDSGKFAIGDVISLAAIGDQGSKASAAFIVVEAP